MKKSLLLPTVLLLCGCTACASNGASTETPTTQVTVFAAASLEASLTEIAETYEAEHAGVELVFNFDSSGTLQTQIEEGAECDLFLSAATKQVDALDEQGLVASSLDLLNNQVVLAVPAENPKNIQQFADLSTTEGLLLCLGNEDVPVGAYSLQILDYLGISVADLEAAGSITYASNVSEVARQVKEGAVDCGMIYATDAVTHELTVVDHATEEMCDPVIYRTAILKDAAAADEAEAFLTYLYSNDEARSVLEDVGFTLLQ